MVGIREAESLPDKITNDEIHYMLAPPSANASAISTDFVRLLRPIYKPLPFALRAQRRCDVNDYSPLPQFIRGRHNSHICLNQTIRSHWIDLL
jgi:hypothetical protein